MGIFSSYNDFLHKLIQDYHVSAGIDTDKYKAGFGYLKNCRKNFSVDENKKKNQQVFPQTFYTCSRWAQRHL